VDSMSDVYLVKPVYKALELLKALGEAGGEKSLAEMATITGIPKSTAFKYLRTLRECGYVAHDSRTDRYRIGLVVWRLGQLAGEQWAVQHVVHPFLEQLRERFDETANLGILDGNDIVYLDIVESRRSLRMRATLGGRHPAYSTALGKAMLAFTPGDGWRCTKNCRSSSAADTHWTGARTRTAPAASRRRSSARRARSWAR
jgi:IclR family acetate operon transcriptional repressor